jgi:hypothetical protein
VVYLINRSLTKIIWNVIPEEAWSDHKSTVKQLHIFGSIYYIHIPKEKHNSNFSDRVHKCINFLGYEEQSKAYFLWDLENQKFVIKHFIFLMKHAQQNLRSMLMHKISLLLTLLKFYLNLDKKLNNLL